MTRYTVTRTRLREGLWDCAVQADTPDRPAPTLSVTHMGSPVPGIELASEAPGSWTLRIPVPQDMLSDGVQTLLIHDAAGGDLLESLTLLAGDALAHDLRGEVDLLRAELDMLKRAFRRHCLETAGR